MVVGVIHKTSHVQGSRNKLVHVCNKGGYGGKGGEVNSSTCPHYKEGDLFASNAVRYSAAACWRLVPNVPKFATRVTRCVQASRHFLVFTSRVRKDYKWCSLYSCDGAGIATTLRAGRSVDRIPVGAKFSVLVQTGPYTVGIWSLSRG